MNIERVALSFRNELFKLFGRKRTYLGFIVFILSDAGILWFWHRPLFTKASKVLLSNNGLNYDDYSGGLSVACFMVALTVGTAAGLFLSLVAGDLFAKEVEEGTMRMVLARPVSRPQLFVIKALTGVSYTFILMLFIGISSLAVGLIGQGRLGDLLAFVPLEPVFAVHEASEGLRRYLLAVLLMSVIYQTVSALALMCSCWKLKPATATVLTLAVLYIDFAFNATPFFATYKTWFLSHHLSCWVLTFRYAPPWHSIATSLLVLGGLTISFWTIGLASFCARDIKN